MKRHFAIALAAAFPMFASAAPENFTIDPFHTYPSFAVEHWGLSLMRGQFNTTAGKFSFDRAAKTGSVELAIATGSITTGDGVKGARPQSRDDHLRSGDFFNVAEFPTMSFKSTKTNFGPELPASVEGNLTLLGVTKPLVLAVDNWKCGPHPVSKKEMCGANAHATFKRSDFGMKYGIPAVGDEITLWVELEAYKD